MDTQPECINGCPEKENTAYVLLQCSHYSAAKRELKDVIEALNLPLDVPTLAGVGKVRYRLHGSRSNDCATK